MKKVFVLFVGIMILIFCVMPSVKAEELKEFVPVDSSGAAMTGNTVSQYDFLTKTVYFKNVTDHEIEITAVDINTCGGDLAVFPFDPVASTYYLDNNEKVAADSVSVFGYPFSMRCRGDAAPGYYSVTFIITCRDGNTGELYNTDVDWDVLISAVPSQPEPEPEPQPVGFVPKILINDFYTAPADVVAGEDFSLVVTFKNTSKTSSVENLKAVVSSDGTFNPVSGSSTMFVQHLSPGGSSTVTINLHAKADAAPGSYNIIFSMNFDSAASKEPITDSETVAIPVHQIPKVKITSLITEGSMTAGNDVNVMTTVNNTGKCTIYNVSAVIRDTVGLLSSEELYLGNLQPGASGNVDVYLTAFEQGETSVVADFQYEDENGNVFTDSVYSDIFISEPFDKEPWTDVIIEPEPEQKPFPWGITAGGIVIVGGIVTAVVLSSRKKKIQRQKDIQAAEELDRRFLEEEEPKQ